MKVVEVTHHVDIEDYASHANLAPAVERLRQCAAAIAPGLRDHTIWMVNSTSEGGGVAELLPAEISLLRQLGLKVQWVVLETDDPDFFPLTKRIHNLLHAEGDGLPTAADRELYERVSHAQTSKLCELVGAGDLVVVHDPQPLGTGAFLIRQCEVRLIWRCHIGVDEVSPQTEAVWQFLRPYIDVYDEVIFSLPDYVPVFLRGKAQIIHPSIDPLSHKNRELSLHKLVGILSDADLVEPQWPLLAPKFEHRVGRLAPNGEITPATAAGDVGLLGRPIITQVSRWDRLKGFEPLLEAFVQLKRRSRPTGDNRLDRVLDAVRLVLAGPDPHAVSDDPEAAEMFERIRRRYRELAPQEQADIAVLSLPLVSAKENALTVNALQRASDIVVQNSLREGFGLTVAEAMWKHKPVLGSARAAGVRRQVRDGVDGRLVDPQNIDAIADALAEMLAQPHRLDDWGRCAGRRVHDDFLIFTELEEWLRLFAKAAASPRARPA